VHTVASKPAYVGQQHCRVYCHALKWGTAGNLGRKRRLTGTHCSFRPTLTTRTVEAHRKRAWIEHVAITAPAATTPTTLPQGGKLDGKARQVLINWLATLVAIAPLARLGAALVHEGQRFWTAHVAGLETVKLETSIFDQRLDRAVEMATTAYTFPNRS